MTWRRVKRLLWLAAWSFWAFVGWRLYVEFPRTLGEPLHDVCAFQGNLSSVSPGSATQRPTMKAFFDDKTDHSLRFCRYDLETGTLLHELKIDRVALEPDRIRGLRMRYAPLSDSLLLFAEKNADPLSRYRLIDLVSGVRVVLPIGEFAGEGSTPHMAPSSVGPWLAVEARLPNDRRTSERPYGRVIVVERTTGKLVRSWPREGETLAPNERYAKPLFVPETDRLLLGRLRTPAGGSGVEHRVEIWRPPFGDRPDGLLFDWKPGEYHVQGLSKSRIVVGKDRREVYDLQTGALKFASAVNDGEHLHFADDGRTFVSAARVWDADAGRMLWSFPQDGKGAMAIGDVVTFEEHWADMHDYWEGLVAWSDWLFPDAQARIQTYRTHDLYTGAVLDRCNRLTQARSWDGKLVVAGDGFVYRGPPQVCWGVLMPLQASLALPLLLVYSLRWWGWRRRKETAR